jgi:acrylyl-CoA reductase (NADPH)
VALIGIDAAWGPIPLRHQIWSRLAGDWKLDCLPHVARFVELDDLPSCIQEILSGQITGRVVVNIAAEHAASPSPQQRWPK